MRRLLTSLAAALLVVATATPAAATWPTSATGTGRGRALPELPPPTLTSQCALLLGNIELSWTPSPATPAVTTYFVEWRRSNGSLMGSRTVVGTSTSVTGVAILDTLSFRVRAVAGGWQGAFSNVTHHTFTGLILPVLCV